MAHKKNKIADNITESLADKDREDHVGDTVAIEFSSEVLKLLELDDLSVIEALAEVCERHSIDEDDVPDLITPKLMAVLKSDSEDKNLIKKSTKTLRLF